MTTSDLARQQQARAIEHQAARKELSLDTLCEMTGYTLPQIALIRNTVAKDARTLVDLALFLTAANDLKLNPLLRQVHWITRGGKGVLQVGIDGYRSIADRTGVYAGSEPAVFRGTIEQKYTATEWVNGQERQVERTMVVPEKASVLVWKIVAGHKSAFTGEAYWTEFYPGQKEGFQWRKMPRHMLGKCAEAQALRKAFPAQLGGVAFESGVDVADLDTLPEIGVPPTVIEPEPEAPRQLPSATAEDYDRIFGDDGRGGRDADMEQYGRPSPQSGVVRPAEDSPPSAAPAASNDQAALDAALERNATLVGNARDVGAKGLGSLTAKAGWPMDKIAEANAVLDARIRSRNSELDAQAAAESAQQAEF